MHYGEHCFPAVLEISRFYMHYLFYLSAIDHADLSVIDYKMPVPAKKNAIYLPVNRFNWR